MAKGRMMAYRLYVDDLEGGTQYMSNEEFGAYMRLLHYQFRYGSVPENDFRNIIKRGGFEIKGEDEMTRSWRLDDIFKSLVVKFELRADGYVNLRMEQSRNDSVKYSQQQAERGSRAKPRQNHGKAADKPRLTHGSAAVQPYGSGSGDKGGVGGKGVPAIEQVRAMFEEHGYRLEVADKAWNYYNDRGWKDSRGNPVVSWEAKMREVWFKPEHLQPPDREAQRQWANEWHQSHMGPADIRGFPIKGDDRSDEDGGDE